MFVFEYSFNALDSPLLRVAASSFRRSKQNICTFYLVHVSAISKRSSATPESALEAANPWSVQHHHPLPTKRTFLLINFYKIDKIQFFVFRFLTGQWIIK